MKDGERGRNRTFNLLIKSQLLCQLSYAPTVGVWLEGQTKIIASDRGFAVAIRRLPSRILVPATALVSKIIRGEHPDMKSAIVFSRNASTVSVVCRS